MDALPAGLLVVVFIVMSYPLLRIGQISFTTPHSHPPCQCGAARKAGGQIHTFNYLVEYMSSRPSRTKRVKFEQIALRCVSQTLVCVTGGREGGKLPVSVSYPVT